MDEPTSIPTSGYHITRVYAVQQHQDIIDVSSHPEINDARTVSFAWDWRIIDPAFEVWLGVTVGASRAVGEKLSYHVVGTFELSEQQPAVPLEDFVARNAIATLLPFIREGLASLSGRGPFSAYYLPPINATKLALEFDYAGSTGSKQLELFPDFRTRHLPARTHSPAETANGV